MHPGRVDLDAFLADSTFGQPHISDRREMRTGFFGHARSSSFVRHCYWATLVRLLDQHRDLLGMRQEDSMAAEQLDRVRPRATQAQWPRECDWTMVSGSPERTGRSLDVIAPEARRGRCGRADLRRCDLYQRILSANKQYVD